MKFVKQGYEIMTPLKREDILKHLELVGRVCYKSEDKITEESASRLISHLNMEGHESILEHVAISVRLITSRATSHQLVRHRMASFAQESQRYCNYTKDKFHNGITFIESGERPPIYYNSLHVAEATYFQMIKAGFTPEEAREVLPNCVKTELVITANPREWKHIFKLRTSQHASKEIRDLLLPLQEEFHSILPEIF